MRDEDGETVGPYREEGFKDSQISKLYLVGDIDSTRQSRLGIMPWGRYNRLVTNTQDREALRRACLSAISYLSC